MGLECRAGILIVHALFEQGVLVRNGDIVLAQPLGEIQMSPTMQGVLAARIDRLEANDKALLQSSAVVGKEFPFSLLKQVVNLAEDDLYQSLSGSAKIGVSCIIVERNVRKNLSRYGTRPIPGAAAPANRIDPMHKVV
jgi:predicted ATPase